jgi:hypothetical protein
MGLFARLTCLRRDGTADDLARTVRDWLKAQHVVEVADLAAAERLMMIAPAGQGWFLLFDHVERPSEAFSDDGALTTDLCSPDKTAVDILIADSGDLVLSLIKGSALQSQLEVGHRGLEKGAVEAWQRLLLPGKSIDDIRKAFDKRTTFIEEHLHALKPLFGIDLAAFNEAGMLANGHSSCGDIVLLRLKSAPAPGETIGPPKLEVSEVQRENFIRNRAFPQIPRGLVTHFPAFSFYSRGGGARGLEVRLTGSALDLGVIEVVSAKLLQRHPVDPELNREIQVTPDVTPSGSILRFHDLEVPDWLDPGLGTSRRGGDSLHDLRAFVWCRGLKIGEGELVAEAHLVAPQSAPVQTSYPVAVLPEVWRPLKGSDQPNSIHDVLNLHRGTRINGLAVLRGGADEAVTALRHTLETWRSLIDGHRKFIVAAATERVPDAAFLRPTDLSMPFKLDLSKKRQARWDRLLADLPSIQALRIENDLTGPPASDYQQRYAARIVLHYMSAAPHPTLPEYAARLGHVSLMLPVSQTGKIALVSLMQTLASEGLVGQAYAGTWNYEDEPSNVLYERAANVLGHQRTAQGWGTRYLRAVADHLWLGPAFAARLPDRAALDRVAVVSQIGDTLMIERRPDATLRDLELCLEPMLASQAESQAFWDRFAPRPRE